MPTGFMEIGEAENSAFQPVEGGITSSMQGMVIKLNVNVGNPEYEGLNKQEELQDLLVNII